VTERHGHTLTDPFHWLEGEEVGEARAWCEAQQALTDGFLATSPRRAEIHGWLHEFLSRPFVFHAIDTERRRFMLEERPGVEQPVLLAQDWGSREPATVVGPELLAGDGAGSVLAQEAVFPSPCGRYLAYAVRTAGSDFATLRLKDVERDMLLETDFPLTVMPAVSWSPDSRGFFYNQNQGDFVPAERRASRPDGIYRHELGASAAADRLVHGMDWAPAHAAIPTATADGRFLFVNLIRLVADVSALTVQPLEAGEPVGEPVALCEPGLAAFSYIGEKSDRYYFETDLAAADGRIIAFDLSSPAGPRIIEIVPPQARPLARSTRPVRAERSVLTGERLYLTYIDKAAHRVAEFDLAGRHRRDLDLPPAVSVGGPGGDRYGALGLARDGRILIAVWTFATAPCAYVCDPATGALEPAAPARPPPALEGVDIRQIEYPGSDGTPIPATIIAMKQTPRDGSAPCLLYGYGAAGMAITPEFALDIVGWLALGGVYMLANVRGGGERGEAWRTAARGADKQVAFDDFCAAADYLIAQGLARPASLAIRGLSAGGLLVGVCLTQRPELFGAVIAELPLLDPLSIGRDYWSAQLAPETGDPTRDPKAFESIARYSPLQNVAAGVAYPPTLVVVADCDAPLLVDGARKFIAAIQSADRQGGPHLLHIVRGAGHGGWSKSQQLDTASRVLAFLAMTLSGPFNDVKGAP
jgi:prolyl oligopeptidase